MIDTIFGPMDEASLERATRMIQEDEDRAVETIEFRLKGTFVHEGREHTANTLVESYKQVRAKRVSTIFGIMMDVDILDKHIEVTDNENEFTQCPEYRLKEPYVHEGLEHPAGTLVHRSVHVQLKKNVIADGVTATFG